MCRTNSLPPFARWMLAGVLAAPAAARAGVTAFQLGDQDFAGDGGRVLDAQIRAAGGGEAYPFDGTVFGDDRTRVLGSIRFTHHFDPAAWGGAGSARSATLTLGVIDIDSPPGAPGTVRLWFNGVPQPADAFAGISAPGIPSSAEVVTVPVPLDLLAAGELTVELDAVRPAPKFRGNAIAVDFSRLAVETSPPLPPPDDGGNRPPTGVPLPRADTAAFTLAALALLRRMAGYIRNPLP